MKNHYPIELNFDTLECEETFDAKLLHACERVKSITNPYVGNKRKILYNIIQQFNDINPEFETVLDLFSGSACLGVALRLIDKKVISNDILESSSYYASSFTAVEGDPLSHKDKELLLSCRNVEKYQKFINKYASRFTNKEIQQLLSFKENLLYLYKNNWVISDGYDKADHKYAYAMANIQLYIIDHCFVGGRLNSGQVLANKDHRIAHQRNRGHQLNLNNISWKKMEGGNTDNLVLSMDALSAIDYIEDKNINVDIVYIDPPYGGSQSDYGFMYGFFEDYANVGGFTSDSKNRAKEKFINSSDYKNNFIELISSLNTIPAIIISYNDSSWADIDTIQKILKRQRKNVEVKEIDYEYRYRKQSNTSGKEYLIIAE